MEIFRITDAAAVVVSMCFIRKPFLFVFISRPAAAATARAQKESRPSEPAAAAEGVIPQKSFISFFFHHLLSIVSRCPRGTP